MYLPRLSNSSRLFKLISEEQWEDAKNRAKYYPKEAKVQSKICSNGSDYNKLLPLHHACALNPTVEATEALLLSYPKAAQKRDSLYKRLPIHVACLYGASGDVVRTLLEAHRDGAKEPMKDGQLPLHYACGSGATIEVIQELLRANPEGAKHQDVNGWLPIHLACLQNAPVAIIKLLADAYPESVSIKTDRGNTPIQCAKSIKNIGRNRQLVVLLLRRYELSSLNTESRDDSWMLPSRPMMSEQFPIKRRANTAF